MPDLFLFILTHCSEHWCFIGTY